MRRDFAQIPDDAEPGENLQGVVGDIDFPPIQALARRSHKETMVVVPAFAEGEQGEEPVVAAGVGGLVATRSKKDRERIDGKRIVNKQQGVQADAPYMQI